MRARGHFPVTDNDKLVFEIYHDGNFRKIHYLSSLSSSSLSSLSRVMTDVSLGLKPTQKGTSTSKNRGDTYSVYRGQLQYRLESQ